jgi:HlyD family secretion protein
MHSIQNKFPRALWITILAFTLMVTLSACQGSNGSLKASGTVEAVQVVIAPEMSGRVAEVYVNKGDRIEAGDALFKLEDTLLAAQRKRASAALETAQANLGVTKTALETAQAARQTTQASVDAADVQYQLIVTNARLAYQPTRVKEWSESASSEFDLPAWYFQKSENIAAAQAEITAAWNTLESEKGNFETVIKNASNEDLKGAESRLANAQTAFEVAKEVKERQVQNGEDITNFAQTLYDNAKAELNAAQKAYDKILSEQFSKDVLEARARLAVAQEQYETVLYHLDKLLTGEDALQVKAAKAALDLAIASLAQAEANVNQAQAAIAQAEKAVGQSQAELDLIDVQIGKLTVHASVYGIIMTRDVELGEVV